MRDNLPKKISSVRGGKAQKGTTKFHVNLTYG